jgi:hypothetical protein
MWVGSWGEVEAGVLGVVALRGGWWGVGVVSA